MRKNIKPKDSYGVTFYTVLATMISSLFLSGCLATSKEIVELRDDINQLRIKLNEVQINQADLTEKMSSMDLSMSALSEKLEDNKNVMALVANRLDDIESGISSKFSRLESRIDAGFNRVNSDMPRQGSATPNSLPSNAPIPSVAGEKPTDSSGQHTHTPNPLIGNVQHSTFTQSPAPPKVDSAPSPEISPGALYRMAYDDFISGRYESATATFKVFLEKYPNASLAPYARYYMGESRYARSLFEGALEDFEDVIKSYPRSDVFVPALYKKALVLERLKRSEAAKKIYSDIIAKYPTSQEAAMSAERLKDYTAKNNKTIPQNPQGEKE